MAFKKLALCALALTIGACGNGERREGISNMYAADSEYGYAEEVAEIERIDVIPIMEAPSDGEQEPGPNAPQIAYSYDYGFRVDANDLPVLQQRHVELCASMEENCRILNQSSRNDEDLAFGNLSLKVAAAYADTFNDQLASSTDGVDAQQVSYSVRGDDLTDNIIDTEARLEGRRVLRDRLMDVLRNRQGSVADLVEAERGVAQVNEEIDSAASRLANLRGRVAFSSVDIRYNPDLGNSGIGMVRPIQEAFSAIGTTLGVTIAALIYILTALVPITITFLGLRWLWRKSGLRLWRRKKAAAQAAEEPAAP